jgi:hypothetical protein
MSSPQRPLEPGGHMGITPAPAGGNLADILERILDKGIVVAGDIRINLLDIELLTVKIRLVIASVDKAREMGIDWWESDRFLSHGDGDGELEKRLERIEEAVGLPPAEEAPDEESSGKRKRPARRDGGRAPR